MKEQGQPHQRQIGEKGEKRAVLGPPPGGQGQGEEPQQVDACDRPRHEPVAAAAALLAMLGTEGDNTDYTAHLAGLGCGLLLGALEAWQVRKYMVRPNQWIVGAATALVCLTAWWRAFSSIAH